MYPPLDGCVTPGAIALTPAEKWLTLCPSGNGETNDGLLTSSKIFAMKRNAEPVVLSWVAVTFIGEAD